jgi:hypothetical protein
VAVPVHAKVIEVEVVQLHSSLTSALAGDELSDSCPNCFASEKEPCYRLNTAHTGPQQVCNNLQKQKNLLLSSHKFKPRTAHPIFYSLTIIPELHQSTTQLLEVNPVKSDVTKKCLP